MTDKPQPSKRTTDTPSEGFTEDERAAMKERARELKAAKRRSGAADKAAEDEKDVLAKVAELPEGDRALAERVHALIRATAPSLLPRTWYGMPAYAKDGKVVCFFQGAEKFKARYATLGFSDQANLDDGDMWPTAYALTELSDAMEARVKELVTRAVS